MKKLAMTLVTVITVTVFAASAFAYGPGWGRGHGGVPCYGVDGASLSELNLTAEQTAKIAALREAHLKDVKPLQDKMFSKRGELRLLWLKQNPDEDKIVAVQKEIRTIRDQMQDKRTLHRLDVLKVLTPEQQEQLKAFGPRYGFGRGMKGEGYYERGHGYHRGGHGMMRGNW